MRRVPAIQRKIDAEIGKIAGEMEASVDKRTANLEYFMTLPELGLSRANILDIVDAYLGIGDFEWKDGHVSGAVYNLNADLCDLVGTVYQKTSYTNPLHSDVFPGINKMEAEVVRMCVAMFNGGQEAVGTVCLKKNFFSTALITFLVRYISRRYTILLILCTDIKCAYHLNRSD